MRLAESNYDNAETGCCAKLDRAAWDEREVTFQDRPFLKDHVRALFRVPLNFGAVMKRGHALMEEASAYPKEPLWLTDEGTAWGSDVYMAMDRDLPGAEVVRMSGTFLTKVFEGPYRDAGKWMQAMKQYVADQGHSAERYYFYYATCPKCAKHFGTNQVVLFAKVAGVD